MSLQRDCVLHYTDSQVKKLLQTLLLSWCSDVLYLSVFLLCVRERESADKYCMETAWCIMVCGRNYFADAERMPVKKWYDHGKVKLNIWVFSNMENCIINWFMWMHTVDCVCESKRNWMNVCRLTWKDIIKRHSCVYEATVSVNSSDFFCWR